MDLIPFNSYILQAHYQWLLDNNFRPYIRVLATNKCKIPHHILQSDSTVVLNISPLAVGNFSINRDFIIFNARFNGKSYSLEIPINNVLYSYSPDLPTKVPSSILMLRHEAQELSPGEVLLKNTGENILVNDESVKNETDTGSIEYKAGRRLGVVKSS